tara:strand:- start:575 stop:766 length:192 start_codon:yes stop_codon:yes gene_type:complete
MNQELIIKNRLHRLNLAYIEETMRRKVNYFYVDHLATRIREEETKLNLLKINSYGNKDFIKTK